MQTLAELDLPHLELEAPAFGEDPRKHFNEARKKHPWLATSNFGLVIHEFTAIRDLFPMEGVEPAYDSIVGMLDAHGTPWGRFTEQQMISLPPEEHKLLRHTFAAKFTPRFANQLRPVMRATIGRLLDEWVPRESFDFAEFASWFPMSVMFSMVGAPVERVGGIRADLETLGLAFSMDKSRVPALQGAITRLDELVQQAIAERRADPDAASKDDLLNLLITTGDEGRISHRQLVDLIMFFFIAGYDTSKNVLTYTMYLLMQHPEIYQRCAEDLDYCEKVLEESLRYFNPASVGRITTQDVVFRDVLLPKDTMLFFTLNISGRDPEAFENPELFDPDRVIERDKRHVAFGLGKHMCLGQYIAKAQLQEALHLIAQRIREPKLAGEVTWRPYPGSWGLRTLPIAFTPAPAP